MISRDETDPEPDPGMDTVTRLLDEVAAREARDVQAAEELEDAPGLLEVERVLEEVWARPESDSGRRRWLRLLSVVTALAALVLIFVWLRGKDGRMPKGPSDTFLGSDEFKVSHPSGIVNHWNPIEWSGPKGARYVVRVFDAETDARLLEPVPTLERSLTLSPELIEKWPLKIRIEVEMRHKDGSVEVAASVAELHR